MGRLFWRRGSNRPMRRRGRSKSDSETGVSPVFEMITGGTPVSQLAYGQPGLVELGGIEVARFHRARLVRRVTRIFHEPSTAARGGGLSTSLRLILADSRYALIALTAKIGARLVSRPPALRLATRFMKYPG